MCVFIWVSYNCNSESNWSKVILRAGGWHIDKWLGQLVRTGPPSEPTYEGYYLGLGSHESSFQRKTTSQISHWNFPRSCSFLPLMYCIWIYLYMHILHMYIYIYITPADAWQNDKIHQEPTITISMLISISISLYIYTCIVFSKLHGLLDHMPSQASSTKQPIYKAAPVLRPSLPMSTAPGGWGFDKSGSDFVSKLLNPQIDCRYTMSQLWASLVPFFALQLYESLYYGCCKQTAKNPKRQCIYHLRSYDEPWP